MVTVLLLAGGKSLRMGQDKALMEKGVEYLHSIAIKAGVDRIVTLCGAIGRESLFEGEVWPDPKMCTSLSEVLQWAFSEINDSIQLISCDSFNLKQDGLEFLLASGGGVPLDDQGRRQPLLAHCPKDWKFEITRGEVRSMFSSLQDLEMGSFAQQMKNFNSMVDL
tara:strand:+ start:1585 stop:2079 length:495 start_codon:yes stop_codon:yes gene_type:complete